VGWWALIKIEAGVVSRILKIALPNTTLGYGMRPAVCGAGEGRRMLKDSGVAFLYQGTIG
jgi:hypothetical protein